VKDIRWVQRYNHFLQAFEQLEKAIELSKQRDLSELEEQGLIQAFEYTHELAWNVLKDFLEHKHGIYNLYGSKDTTRQAFKYGLIKNGEIWMSMIKSRNLTSHTYNSSIAQDIVNEIKTMYYDEFKILVETIKPFITEE
jgi:nucleotidyltransferase substrate binding protein (TIGR01987 family)